MQPSDVSKDKFYEVYVTFNRCEQKLNFKILKNLTLNDLYKKIKTIFFPDEEIDIESDMLSILFKKLSTNSAGYILESHGNIKFYSKNTPLSRFVFQSQNIIDLNVNTDFR